MPRFRSFSRHPKTPRELGRAAATALALQEIIPAYMNNEYNITFTLLAALVALFYFETIRYLNTRPAINVFKSPVYRDQVLSQLSPVDLKKAMRVTPRQFNFIVEVIQDHSVFLSRGRKPQREVATQLKAALHRLGHDGSHGSYDTFARIFGISVGSVVKYTQRCIDALCDNIARFVSWPDAEEKTLIKVKFEGSFRFPNIIGAIDGTLTPFVSAPTLDRNSWATRTNNFAMGATGVCDHRAAFVFFSTGYPGSWHDSAAFKATDLYRHPARFFSGEEYMTGDAAYGLLPTLMTRFRGHPEGDQNIYSKMISALRSKIEHAFGMLKGRWKSLTNLWFIINSEKSIADASRHIAACVVLHNTLTKSEIFDDDEIHMLLPPDPDIDEDERQGPENLLEENGESESESEEDYFGEDELTAIQQRARRRVAEAKCLRLMQRVIRGR